MALKGLIFDVDGTLADTELEGHLWAFNRAFCDAGLVFQWDMPLYKILLEVAGGENRIRHYLAAAGDIPPLEDECIAELQRRKTLLFIERVKAGKIPWRSGVRRLIHEAVRSGIAVGIATTTHLANVHALLQTELGEQWPQWVNTIASGDLVSPQKPDPAVYHLALEQMALRPEEVIAFEDSAIGLSSAAAAGIATVVTANIWTAEQEFRGALAVLNGLGEPGQPAWGYTPEGKEEVVVDCSQLHRWLARSLRAE
jgi:beta-phosphoglucomutase-like phosphatase (HAD superfamily)